jgi:hypothetical protein
MEQASLVPFGPGKWYWLVTYQKQYAGLAGYPETLYVVVLMDGKVVRPTLCADPGKK